MSTAFYLVQARASRARMGCHWIAVATQVDRDIPYTTCLGGSANSKFLAASSVEENSTMKLPGRPAEGEKFGRRTALQYSSLLLHV